MYPQSKNCPCGNTSHQPSKPSGKCHFKIELKDHGHHHHNSSHHHNNHCESHHDKHCHKHCKKSDCDPCKIKKHLIREKDLDGINTNTSAYIAPPPTGTNITGYAIPAYVDGTPVTEYLPFRQILDGCTTSSSSTTTPLFSSIKIQSSGSYRVTFSGDVLVQLPLPLAPGVELTIATVFVRISGNQTTSPIIKRNYTTITNPGSEYIYDNINSGVYFDFDQNDTLLVGMYYFSTGVVVPLSVTLLSTSSNLGSFLVQENKICFNNNGLQKPNSMNIPLLLIDRLQTNECTTLMPKGICCGRNTDTSSFELGENTVPITVLDTTTLPYVPTYLQFTQFSGSCVQVQQLTRTTGLLYSRVIAREEGAYNFDLKVTLAFPELTAPVTDSILLNVIFYKNNSNRAVIWSETLNPYTSGPLVKTINAKALLSLKSNEPVSIGIYATSTAAGSVFYVINGTAPPVTVTGLFDTTVPVNSISYDAEYTTTLFVSKQNQSFIKIENQ